MISIFEEKTIDSKRLSIANNTSNDFFSDSLRKYLSKLIPPLELI